MYGTSDAALATAPSARGRRAVLGQLLWNRKASSARHEIAIHINDDTNEPDRMPVQTWL
ncbi:hypothetical protein LZ32DRAFT_602757 [Colletotrichum eremochloae]|nr:hypothetical protein LY78DRAFT_658397 [Colletotrichum sublineola]KAK2015056.1 hypothetical protein LZ32DRAFT_602757 [Colletotrichum eremochloae]